MTDLVDLRIATTAAPPDDDPNEQARQQRADFMSTMRKRFRWAAEASAQLRADQLEDLEFSASKQWEDDLVNERAMDGRPCLTINRLPQFIRQVTNQQRATRPSIQVNPKKGPASVDTAEIIQGLIRDIEIQSDADIAYATAAESQAKIGLGYWRVITEYRDDDGFEQEIRIRRIRNPFSVYADPSCQEPDYSDARFFFIVQDMTTETFKARFGDDAVSSLSEMQTIGDDVPQWMPGGSPRVVEYWYVDEANDELLDVKFPPDQANPTGHRAQVLKSVFDHEGIDGAEIVNRRTIRRKQVYSALCSGVGVLEGNADKSAGQLWLGKWIPIVPVLGDEIDLNGRVDLRGMIRDARDPQRAYNFWISAATEAVALAPKAPYVGAEGQFEGYEEQWDQANTRNFPRLSYKPTSIGNQLVPPPQRSTAEPPIMAITRLVAQADNDLKATMGFYDASLGERGPEQSGKAILARQKQGEIGNSNYLDNLARAIRQTGRIIVDLIPKVYDTPRVFRVLGADLVGKLMYHQPTTGEHANQPIPPGFGTKQIIDLSAGEHDVTITVAPSFQSLRQEAVSQMGEVLEANPQLFQVMGDLWMGNMDAPWAKEAAARLKKTIPPQLLVGEDDVNQAPIPPQIQQQLAQMGQQLQQAQQALQQAQSEIHAQQLKAANELEIARENNASRERIAAINTQGVLIAEDLRQKAADAQLQLKGELDKLAQIMEQAHEAGMAAHAAALAPPPALPAPPSAPPSGPTP